MKSLPRSQNSQWFLLRPDRTLVPFLGSISGQPGGWMSGRKALPAPHARVRQAARQTEFSKKNILEATFNTNGYSVFLGSQAYSRQYTSNADI